MTVGGDHTRTLSGQLAAFAVGQSFASLPSDTIDKARDVLLDTLGCALAGSIAPEVAAIRRAVAAAGGHHDGSLLWGSEMRVPLPLAALANGAASHAREIDDFEGCAHSGAVVIPAALGTAAKLGADGRRLITSIVVGYDVARRIMEGGGGYVAMKKKGWHTTSTCGVFGAAAAAGSLLGLSERQMQWALGYAGSNAGGTWSFIAEGAMSKRVNPGWAAQTGVMAAYLAQQNVTAPDSILETTWGGFYPTYAGSSATPDATIEGLGRDYKIRIVGVKPYAACRGNHSAIDIALALRAEGLRAEQVRRVLIEGSPTHVKQLAKQEVRTVLDAQFSLPYAVAVALIDGEAMLAQFNEGPLTRSDLGAFARRVEVVHDERVADGEEPYLTFELQDGARLTRRVEIAKGDWRNPVSASELRAKFRATAGLALDASATARLEELILSIATLTDVRQIELALSIKSS